MAVQDVAIATYDPSEVGACVGHRAYAMPVKLAPSKSYAKGEILALPTANLATLVYDQYVTGASDGTQNAECILRYACSTDAAGNVSRDGVVGQFGPYLPSDTTASAWFGGVFKMSDLKGTGTHVVDSGALTAMKAKLQRNGTEISF